MNRREVALLIAVLLTAGLPLKLAIAEGLPADLQAAEQSNLTLRDSINTTLLSTKSDLNKGLDILALGVSSRTSILDNLTFANPA